MFLFFLTSCVTTNQSVVHLGRHVATVDSSSQIFNPRHEALQVNLASDFPYDGYYGKSKPQDKLPKYDGLLDYFDGALKKNISVKLQARGSGRLNHCRFAPFKIIFPKEADQGLFVGPGRDFKIVTHCGHNPDKEADSQKQLLREYLNYKILEALKVPSFKTQLLKMRYSQLSGALIAERYAFVIEPTENLMSRHPEIAQELDDSFFQNIIDKYKNRLDVENIKNELSRLIDINNHVENNFGQLLILNADWSDGLRSGNVKSFLTKAQTSYLVHYDFDLSLLVGKFTSSNNKMVFPATVESDQAWITHFCTTKTDGIDINLQEKKQACLNARNRLLLQKSDVLKTITDFRFLDFDDKKIFLDRANTFFKALEQLDSSILN